MWIALAAASHEVRIDGWSGRPSFVRVALPAAGGVGDQDARTMQALEIIADTARARLDEQVREALRRRVKRADG